VIELAWRYPKREDWGAGNGYFHATSETHKYNIFMRLHNAKTVQRI
jgi:hypothetical protein